MRKEKHPFDVWFEMQFGPECPESATNLRETISALEISLKIARTILAGVEEREIRRDAALKAWHLSDEYKKGPR